MKSKTIREIEAALAKLKEAFPGENVSISLECESWRERFRYSAYHSGGGVPYSTMAKANFADLSTPLIAVNWLIDEKEKSNAHKRII